MESGRKPHLAKHWHSAMTVEQLRDLLALINKIYRRDELTELELRAANDLKTVVVDTGFDSRHRSQLSDLERQKSILAKAISSSVGDPLWRECLEIEVARHGDLVV